MKPIKVLLVDDEKDFVTTLSDRIRELKDDRGWLLKYIPVNDQFTCFHLKGLCQTLYQ